MQRSFWRAKTAVQFCPIVDLKALKCLQAACIPLKAYARVKVAAYRAIYLRALNRD
jgi:hypothetical protein